MSHVFSPDRAESAGARQRRGFSAEESRRLTAETFTAQVSALDGVFPLPGGGRTQERFEALAAAGERDVCVARLLEGHVDAAAILAELGAPPPGPGERWGVWAAQPPVRS